MSPRPPARVGQPRVALEHEVVAEPLGLLVRVDVAADVRQQRGVVEDRPLLVAQLEPFRQPQRDQALPQDVLHRLSEPEVGAEREDRDELGQAHAAPVVHAL
jgi:hypothetical protein